MIICRITSDAAGPQTRTRKRYNQLSHAARVIRDTLPYRVGDRPREATGGVYGLEVSVSSRVDWLLGLLRSSTRSNIRSTSESDRGQLAEVSIVYYMSYACLLYTSDAADE